MKLKSIAPRTVSEPFELNDVLLDFQYMEKMNEIAAEFSEMLSSFETYLDIQACIKAEGGVTQSLEAMFGENFTSVASMEAETDENTNEAKEGLWEKIKSWLTTAWEWVKNLFSSNEKIAGQLNDLIQKLESGGVTPKFPITVKRPKYLQKQLDEATKPPADANADQKAEAPVKEAEDFTMNNVQDAVNECKFVKDALEKMKSVGEGVKSLEDEYKTKEGKDPGFFRKASMYMKSWGTKQFVMSATRAYAVRLQKLLSGEAPAQAQGAQQNAEGQKPNENAQAQNNGPVNTKVLEDSMSKVVDLVKEKVKLITDSCNAELKQTNVIAPFNNPQDRNVNVPKCVGMNNAKFENFTSALNILNAVSKHAEKQFFVVSKGGLDNATAQKLQAESNEMEKFTREFSDLVMRKIEEKAGKKSGQPQVKQEEKKPAENANQQKPAPAKEETVDYEDTEASAKALGKEAQQAQQNKSQKTLSGAEQKLQNVLSTVTKTHTRCNNVVTDIKKNLQAYHYNESSPIVGHKVNQTLNVPKIMGGGTFSPKTIGDIITKLGDVSQKMSSIVSNSPNDLKSLKDAKDVNKYFVVFQQNWEEFLKFFHQLENIAKDCLAQFRRNPGKAAEAKPEEKKGLMSKVWEGIKSPFTSKKKTASGEYSFEDFSVEDFILYNSILSADIKETVSEMEASSERLSDDQFWC